MADEVRNELRGGPAGAEAVGRRNVVAGIAATMGALMFGGRWSFAAAPTPQDKQDLTRIEDYFNSITTMHATRVRHTRCRRDKRRPSRA